jgi:hypothetical protein
MAIGRLCVSKALERSIAEVGSHGRKGIFKKNIHRRDAETLRKAKSKSTPEGAEVAEDAEVRVQWTEVFPS